MAVLNEYLVSLRGNQTESGNPLLSDLASDIGSEPGAEILQRIGTPPRLLLVRSSPGLAQRLREKYHSTIVIEPNQALRY